MCAGTRPTRTRAVSGHRDLTGTLMRRFFLTPARNPRAPDWTQTQSALSHCFALFWRAQRLKHRQLHSLQWQPAGQMKRQRASTCNGDGDKVASHYASRRCT